MPAFIDDGYTLSSTIPAGIAKGVEEVKFEYRPATGQEVNTYLHRLYDLTGEQKASRDAAFIANHLVSWDVKNGKGEPVEITEANCCRLHFKVQSKMLDIVTALSDGEAVGN